jgi:hypothetical protein
MTHLIGRWVILIYRGNMTKELFDDATNLIQALQKIVEEHGNLPVLRCTDDHFGFYPTWSGFPTVLTLGDVALTTKVDMSYIRDLFEGIEVDESTKVIMLE